MLGYVEGFDVAKWSIVQADANKEYWRTAWRVPFRDWWLKESKKHYL